MDPENRDKCFIVMQTLFKHPCTEIFRQPVDTTVIKNYLDIIKKPMDLSTVYNNLKNNKYSSVNRWKDDVDLIWNNAKKFNHEDSTFYLLAERSQKLFQKTRQKHFRTLEKLHDECTKLEEKLDKLLSKPPSRYQDLAILQQLKPKGRKNQESLINYIYENIVKYTDDESQHEIFSLLRMYNPNFGGSAILSSSDPQDIRETVALSSLPPKTLDALKDYIDSHPR